MRRYKFEFSVFHLRYNKTVKIGSYREFLGKNVKTIENQCLKRVRSIRHLFAFKFPEVKIKNRC